MTEPNPTTSRRSFLGTTGLVAAGSALAGVAVPSVHAAEDNTIRVALIGCGGRGTGAAGNALSTQQGPIKLMAMADVFEDRLCSSYDELSKEHKDKVDVSCENQVYRVRRLQECDGYPEAGRRGHSRHAAGVSLGAFQLRDPEGPAHASWKSRSRWMARRPARCSPWVKRPRKRT